MEIVEGLYLDGRVPALDLFGELPVVDVAPSSVIRSGKLSVGDSGMFGGKGVELPLVGGPGHKDGAPSAICRSLVLKHMISAQIIRISASIDKPPGI